MSEKEDMAERIHEELQHRRDYNADELELIRRGRDAEAKLAWHTRTGK